MPGNGVGMRSSSHIQQAHQHCVRLYHEGSKVIATVSRDTIPGRVAQFLTVCSRSKWSKHWTQSPLQARRATDGSKAACNIRPSYSRQLLQQYPRFLEVSGLKPLGKPAIDLSQQLPGGAPFTL